MENAELKALQEEEGALCAEAGNPGRRFCVPRLAAVSKHLMARPVFENSAEQAEWECDNS